MAPGAHRALPLVGQPELAVAGRPLQHRSPRGVGLFAERLSRRARHEPGGRGAERDCNGGDGGKAETPTYPPKGAVAPTVDAGLAPDAAVALEDDTTFMALYGATAMELTWLRQIARCQALACRKGVASRKQVAKRTATRGRLRVKWSFGCGNLLQS